MRQLSIYALCVVLWGSGAGALDLELPVGARLTAERKTSPDSFDAPLAAFDGESVPAATLEGIVERRAWRIPSAGLTPLQVILPLREQLTAAGFDLAFECDARACGGFDFRFNVEVLPGPNIYVNVSRYRYLTAIHGDRDAPSRAVSVLVSVTAGSAYVQAIEVNTGADLNDTTPAREAAPTTGGASNVKAEPTGAVIEAMLLTAGKVILDGLEFETGTSELSGGPYSSLERLAEVMKAQPDIRIVLVGHTDTVGALEGNISLSRARAQSVRARLVDSFGIDVSRLDAEGMGYLAPIATNQTDAGRTQNRRVEAVLLKAR